MTESSRIHQPSRARRLLAVLWLLLCGAAESAEAAPADIHRTIEDFRLELEALRWVADGPKLAAPPWAARNAAPRHLFWQAQELYRKTFQLSEELAGGSSLSLAADTWRRSQPRTAPQGREIRLEDVQRLLADAHDRLKALLRLRDIRVSLAVNPPADAALSNGAALAQIVQASRQVSLMLRRPMPPRDVYNRMLLAIDQAGNLLEGGLYPAPPPLTEGDRPEDVHLRLIECLRLLQTASAAQGVDLLALDLEAETQLQNVRPADNYDLATALISDLAYLGQRLDAAYSPLPRGEYRAPRTVLPSHVQRLAKVLQEQMLALAGSAEPPELAETGPSPTAPPS